MNVLSLQSSLHSFSRFEEFQSSIRFRECEILCYLLYFVMILTECVEVFTST